MKLLDRYILRELALPFVFGVIAFGVVFIAGTLLFKFARLVSEQGVPMRAAVLLFIYWLPGYVVYTFPMAALLATLLAFGRLSGEGETTAMRAGGVSLLRIMVPVIAAGLVVSGCTIAFNETVVPASSRAAQDLLLREAQRGIGTQKYVMVRSVERGAISHLIYAREFNPARGELAGVTYIEYNRGEPVVLIHSERATYRADGKWEFIRGFTQYINPYNRRGLKRGQTIFSSFRTFTFNIGHDPAGIALRRREPEEMTWRELGRYLAQLNREGIPAPELRVQWQHKLSVPFASLIFVVIGAPLGLRSPRAGSALGLGLSVLIIFCYYVLWNYLAIIAGRGAFNPLLAAWLPNIVGLLFGGWLIRRAMG
jgi:lipopolysaccharide export system permease protein